MSRLREAFRPEFLNRIDEIIVFRQLDEAQLRQITSLLLEETVRRLHAQDITVDFTTEAVDWLARRGFQPEFGARPLRRTIQREVGQPAVRHAARRRAQPGAARDRGRGRRRARVPRRRPRPGPGAAPGRPVRPGDRRAARVARWPRAARRPARGYAMRSQTVVSGGSSPVSSGPLASSAAACGGSGAGSADRFVDAAERRAAVEGEHPVGRRLPCHRGVAERLLGVPDPQRVLVEAEHRVGAGGLGRDREFAPLLRLAQPRHGRRAGRREAERRLGPRPRQRHPGPVPAGVVAVRAVEDRVLAELIGDVLHLPQPEFLALVDVDGAGQRHRQQRRRPRPPGAELQVGREAVEVPPPLRGRTRCPPGRTW